MLSPRGLPGRWHLGPASPFLYIQITANRLFRPFNKAYVVSTAKTSGKALNTLIETLEFENKKRI